MTDSPNATSFGLNNETQPLLVTEETATLPNSTERLYYITGEARVIRTRPRGTGSSRANPYSNPIANITTGIRSPPYPRRWDWLPTTLNTWRSEENMEVSNDPMDISPYTQEPTHQTVPVLAARLHRHEARLESLEREQYIVQMYWLRLSHDRIAQLLQEQEDMARTLEMAHQQVIDDRGAIDLLQARLEECEQRSQEAEEYTRVLEQRLTLAEDNARQASRLAGTVDRLVTLMERIYLQ